MKACTVEDLPPPDCVGTGWPWTEGTPIRASVMPDGRSWPRISIITPSLNQGKYIEETIRSVLLQGYPNLEYFVVDGGSTDRTLAILRKYEPWLSGWVSEPDYGQSDAINKGFVKSGGDVLSWLCSDDLLVPGALYAVGDAFAQNPKWDALAGKCYCQFDEAPEKSIVENPAMDVLSATPYLAAIWQPSCFFRRSIVRRAELVQRDLNFCMDRELWCYFQAGGVTWGFCAETLSVYRFTGDNKSVTGGQRILDELGDIYCAYARDMVPLTFWLQRVWLPLVRAHRYSKSASVRIGSRLLSRGLSLGLRALHPAERIRKLQREFYMYGAW